MMKTLRRISTAWLVVAALCVSAVLSPARPQVPYGPGERVYQAFQFLWGTTLTPTTSSATTALTVPGFTAWVCNAGSDIAYVAIGISSVTASTSSMPINLGQCVALYVPPGTGYLAAIAATSSTTLSVATGFGHP